MSNTKCHTIYTFLSICPSLRGSLQEGQYLPSFILLTCLSILKCLQCPTQSVLLSILSSLFVHHKEAHCWKKISIKQYSVFCLSILKCIQCPTQSVILSILLQVSICPSQRGSLQDEQYLQSFILLTCLSILKCLQCPTQSVLLLSLCEFSVFCLSILECLQCLTQSVLLLSLFVHHNDAS